MPSTLYQERLLSGELRADADQQSVLPLLDDFVGSLGAPVTRTEHKGVQVWRMAEAGTPTPKGLYLFGPVGRGKSMLMQLVFDSVPMTEKRRVHFHPFMEELHERMHHAKPPKGVDLMLHIAADIAADARLLCFDEFYVTNIADAMLLGRLLESLFTCGVTLCATSNWPTAQLFQDGHNRSHFMPFMKILQNHMHEVDLNTGADWRRADGAAEPGAQTAEAAFTAFGGQAGQGATLKLGHSHVKAESMTGGKGWFSFAELCEKPLGRAEYMELCSQLKALVVADMPILNENAADAAMRFVVLIDIVYENLIPLRITTQNNVPLEEICTKGPAAFAFQRTLSRLHELQRMF